MLFSVFMLLFYFVLFVFCSVSRAYDLNDVTGSYPYCFTTNREKRLSPIESSQKSYPYTYLEILASTPGQNLKVNIIPNTGFHEVTIPKKLVLSKDVYQSGNQISPLQASKSNLLSSIEQLTSVCTQSAEKRSVKHIRDVMPKIYQDMNELTDSDSKRSHVLVDHKVCEDINAQKVNKEAIFKRDKRMICRSKKHSRRTMKANAVESKSRRKKKKRLLRKLTKKKKKAGSLDAKRDKGTADKLNFNNRTRRRIDSKSLFDMLATPLEMYAETKKNEDSTLSDKPNEKEHPVNNIGDNISSVTVNLNAPLSESKTKTKEVVGENVNKINRVKSESLLSTNDFMKIINNNFKDITNHLLENKLNESPQKNLHFEISDIALKPKDHHSIVYYLNRNVAIPHSSKLDDLYGTQNFVMKSFQTGSVPLVKNKDEGDVKFLQNDNFRMILPTKDFDHDGIFNTNKCEKTTASTMCINKCILEKCLEQARIKSSTPSLNTNCANTCKPSPSNIQPLCNPLCTTIKPSPNNIQPLCNPLCTTIAPKIKCGFTTEKSISRKNTTGESETSDCDELSSRNDANNVKKLHGSLKKTKRQVLPLNLLPAILKHDIEQPIQDGQSKKIFLFLHQTNPNKFAIDAKEDCRLANLFKSNPHMDLAFKDGSSIKKLLPPSYEVGFAGKKDLSSKEILDLFKGKVQKKSKLSDPSHSPSKNIPHTILSLRDESNKSNVSTASLKTIRATPGMLRYNPMYRIGFATTSSVNCSTNKPEDKSPTSNCPTCPMSSTCSTSLCPSCATMSSPSTMKSTNSGKSTSCSSKGSTVVACTTKPTSCATTKTTARSTIKSTNCATTKTTHSTTKTTTCGSQKTTCPTTKTTTCPTTKTTCPTTKTTTCPTKKTTTCPTAKTTTCPTTKTTTCPTTKTTTCPTTKTTTCSTQKTTTCGTQKTTTCSTQETTTCRTKQTTICDKTSTTTKKPTTTAGKPTTTACPTTKTTTRGTTKTTQASEYLAATTKITAYPTTKTSSSTPCLTTTNRPISTTASSFTCISPTQTQTKNSAETKITQSTMVTNSISKCPSSEMSKKPNPITCVFTTTCVNTVTPKKMKDALFEDSWKMGDNTASCGDTSELIEYWKEML